MKQGRCHNAIFCLLLYSVAALMAGVRRVCWADWSDTEDDVLGPWANLASGGDCDAAAAATAAAHDGNQAQAAAPTAKWQGKRKKRKGLKRSLPQATGQKGPSSSSRTEAEPLPVGQVKRFWLGQQRKLSSGVGCCDIRQFVCSVMHPKSHVEWGQLAKWQRELQVQAYTSQKLLNPFGRAALFDLDTELNLCLRQLAENLGGPNPRTLVSSSFVAQAHAEVPSRLDCRSCSGPGT